MPLDFTSYPCVIHMQANYKNKNDPHVYIILFYSIYMYMYTVTNTKYKITNKTIYV